MPGYREPEVARLLGERATALLECQERFLGELRDTLEGIEVELGEATRAQRQGQVRNALSVLEWCDAVQSDLQREGRWAMQGKQPIDLHAFCREAAGIAAAEGLTVHIDCEFERPWWGDASLLADAISRGLDLVRARVGTDGSLRLEIRGEGDRARIRLVGQGEPRSDLDPALVDRFRAAVVRLGGRVVPDELGPGGTGLVLELPLAS